MGRFNLHSIGNWIVAFCLIVMLQPFFIWQHTYIYWAAYIVLVVILSTKLRYVFNADVVYVNLFILLTYIYIISKYVSKGGGGFPIFILYVASFFLLIYVKGAEWKDIFMKFSILFVITLIPAAIQYILVTYFSVDFPYTQIPSSPFNPHEGSIYFKYFFFVTEPRNIEIIQRFYGIYDEPGVVGTVAMMILYANKFDFSNWVNVLALFLGLISLSLFFILSIVVYYIIFGNTRFRLLLLISMILILLVVGSSAWFQHYIFDRFSSGSFNILQQRNNEEFLSIYDNLSTMEILFGTEKVLPFSTTYKYIFTVCGLIPFAFFVFFLFYKSVLEIGKNLRNQLIYILTLFLIVAQRPFINNFIYLFLMIVPMYVIDKKYVINENCKG